MIYYLLNTETYFKIPFNIEKEFIDEMDAIVTLIEMSDLKYEYNFCKREHVGVHCACDGHISTENGSTICFFIHYTGFLQKMQVYKNHELIKQYYSSDFMNALKDFKEATWNVSSN